MPPGAQLTASAASRTFVAFDARAFCVSTVQFFFPPIFRSLSRGLSPARSSSFPEVSILLFTLLKKSCPEPQPPSARLELVRCQSPDSQTALLGAEKVRFKSPAQVRGIPLNSQALDTLNEVPPPLPRRQRVLNRQPLQPRCILNRRRIVRHRLLSRIELPVEVLEVEFEKVRHGDGAVGSVSELERGGRGRDVRGEAGDADDVRVDVLLSPLGRPGVRPSDICFSISLGAPGGREDVLPSWERPLIRPSATARFEVGRAMVEEIPASLLEPERDPAEEVEMGAHR